MSQVVKPYTEEGSKKEQVSTMFDKIAPYYDGLNRFLSLGIDVYWRRRAIRMLANDKPKQVLDVATGTADMTLEIERQLKPQSITGVDIANEMLEIGRKKVKKRNLSDKIELLYGDSENLPLTDNSFDAVTVAFGVRNYENLDLGLREMQRVLKPGGMLVVLEFSQPRLFPFKQLFHSYFRYILPAIGRIQSKDPKAYKYLYESVQAFPDGQAFLDILSKNGYNSTQCVSLTLGICSIYTARKP